MKGFDAWGMGPTAVQAKAAGIEFRTWYSSYDTSKDGPGDGPALYADEGIWSFTNFETTIDRVLTGGRAGGQADMAHAVAEYSARRMPVGAAVALSADELIPSSAFPQALAYYQGAQAEAATLGGYLDGCYGEQALIAYLKQRGAIQVSWRSMSTGWPGGASTAYCDVIQTGGGTIAGASVDFNTALVPFFGQWMPGQLAGADMPLSQQDIAAVAAAVYNFGREDVTYGDGSIGHSVPLGQLAHGAWVAVNDAKTGNAALAAVLAKLAAPVDLKALAAGLVTALTPVVQQALAAGAAPDYDHMAVVAEQHLAATLAQAK